MGKAPLIHSMNKVKSRVKDQEKLALNHKLKELIEEKIKRKIVSSIE